MKLSNNFKADLVALGILFLLIGIVFYRVILFPGSYLFGDGGDGIKNYFTLAYYLQNDFGFHFSGMNYPYGEHISFTDNQPALALLSKFINTYFFDLSNQGVAIINLSLVLSMIFGGFFIYKILKFFGSIHWMSILGAGIIVFLSPQLLRFDAHYALGHMLFIPLNFWLLLKLLTSKKYLAYSIALFATLYIQSFIHLYFLPIGIILVAPFLTCYIISNKFNAASLPRTVVGFLAIGFATIAVLGTLKITDPITDRPENPYGVEVFTSTFESAFLPHVGPLHDIFKSGNQILEGIGYVGILGVIFLGLLVIRIIIAAIKRKDIFQNELPHRHLLNFALITVGVCYFFSTGDLYRWGLDIIAEIIPQLKQFRSLGRFIWVFYYLFTIFMFVQLSAFFSLKKTGRFKNWNKGLVVAALLLFTAEAYWNHQYEIPKIYHPNKSLSEDHNDFLDSLTKNGKQPEDFQGLLSLPLFVIGPEKLQISRGMWNVKDVFSASFQTGLPILDIMLSRTSVSQGMDLIELISSVSTKSRLKSMDQRPILVMIKEEALNQSEREFIANGKLLFKNGAYDIYECPVDGLEKQFTYDEAVITASDSLINTQKVIFKNWNKNQSEAYAGKGALRIQGESILWQGALADTSTYEAAFWLNINSKMRSSPLVRFIKKTSYGKIVFESAFDFQQASVAHNNWLRVDWGALQGQSSDLFEIIVKCDDCKVDELLIKPRGVDVVTYSDDQILKNNFLIH